MSKVIFSESCGNSPKAEFIKQMITAFDEGNLETIGGFFTEDVEWVMLGMKTVKGKPALLEFVDDGKESEITMQKMEVENLITHGNVAAINALSEMSNGDRYAISEFYKFNKFSKGALIEKMQTYMVQI